MNDPDETYDVENSFPMLLGTWVKYMRDSLNHRFRDAGLNVTSEQWIFLVHLAQQDGISQQDLADRYHRSKVSAFNLIKKTGKKRSYHSEARPSGWKAQPCFSNRKGTQTSTCAYPPGEKEHRAYEQRCYR